MSTIFAENMHDVGTTVPLFHTFETLDRVAVPVDPETVALVVKDPNGGVNQADVVREDVGVYRSEAVALIAGQWRFRWTSTNPDRVHEGSFLVRRSEFDAFNPPTEEFVYDLEIPQGRFFQIIFTARDYIGTPIDLTGYTAVASLRQDDGSPSEVPFDVTIPDPTNGQVWLTMASDVTETLDHSGVWDAKLVQPDSEQLAFVSGAYDLITEVTD